MPPNVSGAIGDLWNAHQGPNGFMGNPVTEEFGGVAGGRLQVFQGATIAWHPATDAHYVGGAIRDKWDQRGRDQFGYPTSDEGATLGGDGRLSHFRAMHLDGKPEASIVFTIATQAHEIVGAMRAKWVELNGTIDLGFPREAESVTQPGEGRIQAFTKGTLVYHSITGAHKVAGDIEQRWRSIGGTYFGYPTIDETITFLAEGAFNHFVHSDGGGPASIYWSPSTGAVEMYGHIRHYWLENGAHLSSRGFPKKPEESAGDQIRKQVFQHGSLIYTPGTGVSEGA